MAIKYEEHHKYEFPRGFVIVRVCSKIVIMLNHFSVTES